MHRRPDNSHHQAAAAVLPLAGLLRHMLLNLRSGIQDITLSVLR
jgi:hypothetical protein